MATFSVKTSQFVVRVFKAAICLDSQIFSQIDLWTPGETNAKWILHWINISERFVTYIYGYHSAIDSLKIDFMLLVIAFPFSLSGRILGSGDCQIISIFVS